GETARRGVAVDWRPEPSPAPPARRAVAALGRRPALRPRPPPRHPRAARRGHRQGLPAFFLRPGQPGPQGRWRRRAAAAPGRDRRAARRAPPLGPGRPPDPTLRPARRGGRPPSPPDPRPGRPEVPLRPSLGDARLGGAAPAGGALGLPRPAPR